MPSIEGQGRYQSAILWEASGYDNNGMPTVLAPEGILVRWDIASSGMQAPNTNSIKQTIEVVVNREIPIGSIMWKGTAADLPAAPEDLMKVVGYRETPCIKGRKFQRTVTLELYGNTLPTIVT